MHYSTISNDLELVSVLNKVFFQKKHSSNLIKVNSYMSDNTKKKESKLESPKQYIRVNVRPNRRPMSLPDSIKQITSPTKFYYSPRQSDSIETNPGQSENKNYNYNNNYTNTYNDNEYNNTNTNCNYYYNHTDALDNLRHSTSFKRKAKNKSYSFGEGHINNLQLTRNKFQGQVSSTIYHRKVSVDSFIEQRKKEQLLSNTNPDELIILESKLNSLLSIVTKGKDCRIACCDLWLFYVKSSFITQHKDYFQKKLSKVIIHSLSNLFMLIIILTYDISFELNLFVQLNLLFKTIFTLLQLNYLLLAKFIMNQMDQSNPLINDFTNYLTDRINGETKLDLDEIEICLMIKHNSTSIVDLIRLILTNISQENNTYQELLAYFNNLTTIEPRDLIHFFNNNIFRKETQQSRSLMIQKDSLVPIFTLRLKEPYLPPKKSTKRYTLILSLDEVLVSFSYGTVDNSEEKKGLLFLRPGLINFLMIVKELYELILFTSATKDYVNTILQVIEQDRKFFEHCLYREHCYLSSNERIKDLSKIGRDVTKVIIVDNNANNFKLNMGNGIVIHSFFGYDNNDCTLVKLQSVLVRIAKETYGNDIRKVLRKYHNEITQTISSDIYMRKGENQLSPILINIKKK